MAPRSTSTASWRSASAPRPPSRSSSAAGGPPSGSSATALIAAAGSGDRLGAGGPKVLVFAAGRPLIAWCVAAFASAPSVGSAVVAAPAGFEEEVESAIAAAIGDGLAIEIVTGGATRAESVGRALARVQSELVAVHDAARPLLRSSLVESLISRLRADRGADGVIAAEPVTDTIKRAGDDGEAVLATESRAGLWRAQTPQVFRAARLRAAHAADPPGVTDATDDAALVECAGGRVLIEPGPAENLKVTTPADLRFAELLLAERAHRDD